MTPADVKPEIHNTPVPGPEHWHKETKGWLGQRCASVYNKI